MTSPTQSSHNQLQKLIEWVRSSTASTIGVVPDLTTDTLPVVDQYLKEIVSTQRRKERDTLIAAIGCYFGEVMRLRLEGEWIFQEEDPASWLIEVHPCMLRFSPVGMTGEVLMGCESEKYDGAFSASDEIEEELHEMLVHAAPLSEDAYFSLSGRSEILVLVTDWLTRHKLFSDGKLRDPQADPESSPPNTVH